MGFAQFMEFEEGGVGSSGALNGFQWGGTIFALILLILNRVGRRSGMQSNLLVMYFFTSFPTVLFKILRDSSAIGFHFLLFLQTSSFHKLFQFLVFSYLWLHLLGWLMDCVIVLWVASFV
ncbi:hypothetical protein ACLB2K_008270 [Fragaria x ananassa]